MKIWLMKLRLGFGIWLREYLGISRLERTLGQLRDDRTLEAHLKQLRIDEAQHFGSDHQAFINIGAAVADVKAAVLLLDSRCDAAFGRRGDQIAEMQVTQAREFALIQTERIAAKEEQKKQYTDLVATQQETEQKVDRLLMLLEPQAARLHGKTPRVPDWDEVQRENLTQFEEENNGKSIRR